MLALGPFSGRSRAGQRTTSNPQWEEEGCTGISPTAVGGRVVAAAARRSRRRSSRSSGARASTSPRTTRCSRRSRSSSRRPGQGRPLAISPQDMIPKTVAALDSGTPPDVAYARRVRFPGRRQMGLRGPARGHLRHHRADEGEVRAEHGRDAFLYNDKTKKKAYYAFPMKQQTMHIQYWIDMLGQAGFKESDIPKTWKEYWAFWCGKVQPAYRKATGTRIYGIGQPMGVDSSDSLLLVPDLHGRLQRQAGRRQRQAPGRRSEGEARADRRAQGLHRYLRQGLHAAVLDELEGSRQQRRLPQQDDGADAQRDDLDRGEVARRRQQRRPDRRSSARRRRRTTTS